MPFTRSLILVVALTSASFLSCGGKEDPDGAGGASAAPGGAGGSAGGSSRSSSGLPCDVERVLIDHCQECHSSSPQFGAPSPLMTYADLSKKSVTEPSLDIYTVMQDRLRSSTKPMPPSSRPRLTVEELTIIDDWMNEGLPERTGEGTCPAPDPKVDKPPPSCEPTLRLKPQSPWTMPQNTLDKYVCYGIDLEGAADKRHITGIVPFIDNSTIVHHLLLFTMNKTEDPTPHPCDELFPIEGKAIYAWAPGAPPYLLPEAAGFPVKAGEKTHLMVQVHYSNLNQLDGQKDATELGLCMTNTPRPYDADIMWVGGYDFKLPAHKTSTVECSLTFQGGATQFLPIHIFQAWPHMHKLGIRLESELIQPSGAKQSLGIAAPYSFNDQVVYPMNVEVYPGDKMLTRCTWNNTTDSTVKWGEATNEEMCFNLLAYYPRINLPQYGSPAAAALSPCKMIQ